MIDQWIIIRFVMYYNRNRNDRTYKHDITASFGSAKLSMLWLRYNYGGGPRRNRQCYLFIFSTTRYAPSRTFTFDNDLSSGGIFRDVYASLPYNKSSTDNEKWCSNYSLQDVEAERVKMILRLVPFTN